MPEAGRKINYDHSADRTRGAAARAERTRAAIIEIVTEAGGRLALRPLRAALAKRGLPRGDVPVRAAYLHLEREQKVEVERSAAGAARAVSLPGLAKKRPPPPAEGTLGDWYFAALREEGAEEPWGPSMGAGLGGWCKWATVIRLARRQKDATARLAGEAERSGDLQFAYVCRGGRAPTTRQHVRAVPPGWRRWRSARRALWWLLTWGGDHDGALYFTRPTGRGNYKWLEQPAPDYLPLSYLQAVFPSALRDATPAQAKRRLRRALRAMRRDGVVELAKGKGGWWVGARAQQHQAEGGPTVEREDGVKGESKTITMVMVSQPPAGEAGDSSAPPSGVSPDTPETTPPKVTGEPDACAAEDLVMAEEARRFGRVAQMPAWLP